MTQINFYFDFLSPFSYFAWKRHQSFYGRFEVIWNYKPVLMGKLFSHHNFPGPGEIAAKRKYELKKCFRYAEKNNIPFSPPPSFPFNPLAIIRMATKTASRSRQKEVIDLIFDQIFISV